MLKGLVLVAATPKEWRDILTEEGLPWAVAEEKTEKGIRQALEGLQAQPQDVLCLVETDTQEQLALTCGLFCAGFLQGIDCKGKISDRRSSTKEQLSRCKILLEGLEETDRQFWEEVHARALGLPVQIAETEHLLIREMTLDDLDKLDTLYMKEERKRFFPEYSVDRKEMEARFQAYMEQMYGFYQFGMWAVIEKDSGNLVGRAGFGIAEYLDFSEVDLGYFVGAAYRRKGYAEEACRAVLAYGEERLYFPEISAYVESDNVPSLKLIQKLGFVKAQKLTYQGQKIYRFLRKVDHTVEK